MKYKRLIMILTIILILGASVFLLLENKKEEVEKDEMKYTKVYNERITLEEYLNRKEEYENDSKEDAYAKNELVNENYYKEDDEEIKYRRLYIIEEVKFDDAKKTENKDIYVYVDVKYIYSNKREKNLRIIEAGKPYVEIKDGEEFMYKGTIFDVSVGESPNRLYIHGRLENKNYPYPIRSEEIIVDRVFSIKDID